MSSLLMISYGPIQTFIASSRKTRDLKAGSRLLVEIGMAIGRRLSELGAKPIIPHKLGGEAANVILCEIAGDPKIVAGEARKAGLAVLMEALSDSKLEAGLINEELAKAQLNQMVEYYAGWSDFSNGDFIQSRRRAELALAASKSTRAFLPAPSLDSGLPKSSLDPSWDNVIQLENGKTPRRYRNRLKGIETLDVASVIKRFNKKLCSRFDSTRAVSMSCFLKSTSQPPDGLLEPIARWGSVYAPEEDLADLLALDLPESVLPDEARELRQLIRPVKDWARSQGIEWPRPFYAILAADGDRMGEAIQKLGTPNAVSAFSEALSDRFTSRVSGLIDESKGSLVYAGGDDVLALLPVENGIETANKLSQLFKSAMQEHSLSLSVGLAIVPVHDDLQSSLQFARELESAAKSSGRDALAIGARTPTGELARVIARFGHDDLLPHTSRMQSVLQVFSGESDLPRGYPYEIAALAEEIRNLSQEITDPAQLKKLIQGEIVRITARKLQGSEESKKPELERLGGLWDWIKDPSQLDAYAALLKIAHFLTRGQENK